MKILGAIIAGGKARRFGSDKAVARTGGRRLIDIVADGLGGQVETGVICGRQHSDWLPLPDRPAPDLGPLGGLCAALHHAKLNDYDAVLSVAADVIPVPPQLAEWLAAQSQGNTRATVVKGQHLLGLWPAALADDLDAYLDATVDRSLRAWIAASGAIPVALPVSFANINTPEDLQRLNQPEMP